MTSLLEDLLAYPKAEAEVLPWPAELPTHLSASSLTMYARCRNQWRFRYLKGYKEPPKGYYLWGQADSRAAEHNFRQKIDSHEDVPVAEIQDVFAATIDELVDESGGESEIEWDKKMGKSAADVKDSGTKLAAHYHSVAAPRVQPIACEEKLTLIIPGVPVDLIGYVDVETDGVVVERKTRAAKFSSPPGDYLAQARIYQLAREKPVHFHVSTKTQLPAVYTPIEEPGLETPWSKATGKMTQRWIASTVQSILTDFLTFGPDEPWPGAHTVMRDPCGFCGYFKRCEWQGGAG